MELSSKQEKGLIKIGEGLRELRKQAGYKSYENFAFDHEINWVQNGLVDVCNFEVKASFAGSYFPYAI
jgi:hypothetical protein